MKIRLTSALAAAIALLIVPATALAQAPRLWAGGSNTCAVVNGAAYCWGDNTDGQVGNNSFARALSPAAVQGLSSGVSVIVTSGAHSCAIANDAAYCWGNNDYGQLGNNASGDSPVPVAVSGLGSGVTAIAVGDLHTCAVHNGAAKCWGSGGFGQLGTGGSIFSTPVPVAAAGLGSGIVDVTAGKHHACALTGTGAVACWGRGDSGELGHGANVNSAPGPVAVTGYGSGVGLVSAGGFFTCGVQNGGAQCWGLGLSGRLGTGSTANRNTPGAVSGLASGVSYISAGNGLHACALAAAGPMCWGGNNAGQLGNAGVPGGDDVPVAVQGLPGGVIDITAGGLHTCAATAAAIYCWGDNTHGQLGTGNQNPSGSPVLVLNVPASPNGADLVIAQVATPNPASAGKDIVVTLVVGNNGPAAATGVTVTYPIPAGSTATWVSPGCALASGIVTCGPGSLALNEVDAVVVVIRPTAAGSLGSQATVAATQADPVTADNSSLVNIPVGTPPAGVPTLRYRLYSPVTLEHHFTTDLNEYTVLGNTGGAWIQEGTVGSILNNPGPYNGVQSVPYYRLYDNNTRWHHWTTDPNEYYTLGYVFSGWNMEGIDGYIFPTQAPGTVELYRLNYPALGSLHHWTIDPNEYTTLIAQFGWIGEPGAGFVVQ